MGHCLFFFSKECLQICSKVIRRRRLFTAFVTVPRENRLIAVVSEEQLEQSELFAVPALLWHTPSSANVGAPGAS